MSKPTTTYTLAPRNDNWDDLMELLEDLRGYTPSEDAQLYPVVQAIAEGRSTQLKVYSEDAKVFVDHMREFRIDATPA